jgi:hypothetical protein
VRQKDLFNQVFGQWTVLRKLQKNTSGNLLWECKCTCGNLKAISGSELRLGRTTKCSNCRIEGTRQEVRLVDHRLYSVWIGMRRRCNSLKSKDYPNYGGRGITVCERWQNFKLFLEDMEDSFIEGLTLDRKENNGNYTPENCKWSTITEQNNNKKR